MIWNHSSFPVDEGNVTLRTKKLFAGSIELFNGREDGRSDREVVSSGLNRVGTVETRDPSFLVVPGRGNRSDGDGQTPISKGRVL